MKMSAFFDESLNKNLQNVIKFLYSINWIYTFVLIFIHVGGIYGFYVLFWKAKLYTYIWVFCTFLVGGIGLGPGVHRYFCHKSFKANRAVHLFLIFSQTLAGQFSIREWIQVHRAHHKYTDTNADPTNIKRGFLFSHFYWICKFTPECERAIQTAYIKDIEMDRDIMFQYRNYFSLLFICCILIPTLPPYFLWSETIWISFWSNIFRWCLNWNQMGCANSLMHMYGTKPYDKNISASTDIFSIFFTFGEGYHNYHHVFPWDYRQSEFGDFLHFNISAVLIDVLAKFGWVYDRKIVTQKMIDRRKARTGDGSHWLTSEQALKNPVWGYGDTDMDAADLNELNGLSDH